MDKSSKIINFYRKNKYMVLLIIMILCVLLAIFSDNTTENINNNTSNTINATNDTYNDINNIIHNSTNKNDNNTNEDNNNNNIDINNIPPYSGNAYVILNNNIPKFEEKDFTTEPFEYYSDFDEYGRCRVAFANICKEIMPKDDEERGDIRYDPTGWIGNQHEYPHLINTRWLYNRCHLIAWQLSNENNNEKNLITGTAYMNQAMRKWETDVDKYIEDNKEKDYHVLYRVTPIFEGNNLVASGVHIEAWSVEERKGKNSICFNIYIYNVQPGIEINYATGENYEKLLLTD